jgi:ABC-type sugar transport system ATPase subunit
MIMASPYLRMRGISKRFPGVVALRRADLDVYAGEAHAVMGANGAGKSTLMNILGGVIGKDEGEISIGAQPVDLRSPIQSLDRGIAFVYQELSSLPTMTVAENVFADGLPRRLWRVDFAEADRRTAEILVRLGSSLDPRTPVSQLSTGDRQLVEIARALRRNPTILVFDEPTSSLSQPERQRLFELIRGLKQQGVAVIYITHFVDEIFVICERVTVLRNGETVFNSDIGSVTARDVVHQMMGAVENEIRLAPYRAKESNIVLEVQNLARGDELCDVSFTLRTGEILGIWGLLGSGRTELVRAIVGLDPIESGRLRWRDGGGELAEISPSDLYADAALVTEDRRGEGLFLPLSAADNIVLPSLRLIAGFAGIIDRRKQKVIAQEMIRRLNIQVAGDDQKAATLSGGNQQKLVFARWLATAPRLFLLDEPTRGLDIGAKTEILKLILELAAADTAVLLISSEIEELTRVCDRYLVMSRGRIVGELPATATQRDLLAAVSGHSPAIGAPA